MMSDFGYYRHSPQHLQLAARDVSDTVQTIHMEMAKLYQAEMEGLDCSAVSSA